MSLDTTHDPLEIDRKNARLAVFGLAIWLLITVAVIGLLLQFGPALSGIFV